MKDLSIIIVNYRSAALITDALKGLFQHTDKTLDYEVIVVDNDSGDESEILFKEAFPQVIFHPMGYNAGFARANNAGMELANGKVFLLLNPDTLIHDNAIGLAYDQLQASGHVACGVQLLNADGSEQISGSHFMKGSLNLLLPLPYWGNFLRSIAFAMQVKKPHVLAAEKEVKVDWISGAFLMVKRSAVDKAGKMDPDFFLYGEEVEWCNRLGKLGSLCIFGNAKITHLMGQAIGDATNTDDRSYSNLYDKKGLQLMVSNLLFVRKKWGLFWMLFHLANYTWTIPVFGLLGATQALVCVSRGMKTNFLKRWTGFTFNVMELIAYATLRMMTGRPYFYKCF